MSNFTIHDLYTAVEMLYAGVTMAASLTISIAPDVLYMSKDAFLLGLKTAKGTFDITAFVAQYITASTIAVLAAIVGILYLNRDSIRVSVRTYLAAYEGDMTKFWYWSYLAVSTVSSKAAYAPMLLLFAYQGDAFRVISYTILMAYLNKLALYLNPYKIQPTAPQEPYIFIQSSNGERIRLAPEMRVNEMATAAIVNKRKRHVHELVLTTQDTTFLGQATLVKRNGKLYIVTAAHVIEDLQYVVLVADSKAYKLEITTYEHVLDIALIEVSNNVCSILGLRATSIAQMDTSACVKLAYSTDAKQWSESMGGIPKLTIQGDPCFGKHVYTHVSTTEPGASGAGIFQNNKLVGVHCGSVPARGVNRFQSLIHFVDNIRSKHKKIGESQPFESSTVSGDYEDYDDDDIEEAISSRFVNREYQDEYRQETHNLLREKKVERELRDELMDLHHQGYTINSSEARAVVRKHRSRLINESAKIKQIRISYELIGEDGLRVVEQSANIHHLNRNCPMDGRTVIANRTFENSRGLTTDESTRQRKWTDGVCSLESNKWNKQMFAQDHKVTGTSSSYEKSTLTPSQPLPTSSCEQLLSSQIKSLTEELYKLAAAQAEQAEHVKLLLSLTQQEKQAGGEKVSSPTPNSTTPPTQPKVNVKSSKGTSNGKGPATKD
jgi:hypothetical protein